MTAAIPTSASLLKRPVLCILLPTLMLFLYWKFVYTPRYACEVVVMATGGEAPEPENDITNMLGAVHQSRSNDATFLEHYFLSPDLLDHLNEDLDLRKAFSSPSISFWQRLSPVAPAEDFLNYYRSLIRVSVDSQSSILRVSISAFDPDTLKAMTDSMIRHAEDRLRDVSSQMASYQLHFIESEIEKADKTLHEQTDRLLAHQIANNQFDPARYSSTLVNIIGELELRLSKEQTSLSEDTTFLARNSLELARRQARIQALQDEINRQKNRLAGQSETQTQPLVGEMMSYNAIAMETEFATRAYTASSLALQTAQAEAALNIRSLVVVSRPSRIDTPMYPRLAYWTLTALAIFSLIYALGYLIHDTIMWHYDR